MRPRLTALLTLAFVGLVCISCGGIVDPSQNQVDPFSGSVPPGGGSINRFTASKTGEIQVKMLTITPAAVSALLLQWVGAGDGSCNGQVWQQNIATQNSTAISGQIQSGNYCLLVSDYIGQQVTANYSLTVSHP